MPPEYGTIEDEEIAFDIFPHLPQHMNLVAKYLSASLLHAINFLMPIMPSDHSFFQTCFMSASKHTDVTSRIKVKYAWEEDAEVFIEVVPPTMIDRTNATMLVGTNTVHSSYNDNNDLGPVATTRIFSTCGDRIKKATGIPAHVLLLAEMKKVIPHQKELISDLRNVVSSELAAK